MSKQNSEVRNYRAELERLEMRVTELEERAKEDNNTNDACKECKYKKFYERYKEFDEYIEKEAEKKFQRLLAEGKIRRKVS